MLVCHDDCFALPVTAATVAVRLAAQTRFTAVAVCQRDVVRVLHQSFRKSLEDPKVHETLDKFFMPMVYTNMADYTALW